MAGSWSSTSSGTVDSISPALNSVIDPATTLLLLDQLPFAKTTSFSNALTTFHVFDRLPLELRLAIWDKTFLPRAIELTYDSYTNDGFTSPDALPAALLVCRESRALAVASYPLCFGSLWHPAKIRFNFSLDILYITSMPILPHLFGIMTPDETSHLRYIAIEPELLNTIRPDTKTSFKRVLQALPALDEFLIVYNLPSSGHSKYCGSISCTIFGDNIPMEIFDRKNIAQKLREDDWDEFNVWKTPKCCAVYGWKECTCLDRDSDSDSAAVSDVTSYEEHDGFGFGYDTDDDYMYPDGYPFDSYLDTETMMPMPAGTMMAVTSAYDPFEDFLGNYGANASQAPDVGESSV